MIDRASQQGPAAEEGKDVEGDDTPEGCDDWDCDPWEEEEGDSGLVGEGVRMLGGGGGRRAEGGGGEGGRD